MASYQVDGECYPNATAASAAAAAREIGKVVQIGTASYVVDVSSTSATSITYTLRNVSNSTSVTKVAQFTPVTCGLIDTTDSIVIAWGIAAAWIAAYTLKFISNGIHA
jgi:hypothetical protein